MKATRFEYREGAACYQQELLCSCGEVFYYVIPNPDPDEKKIARCPKCGEMGIYRIPWDWYEPYYGHEPKEYQNERS